MAYFFGRRTRKACGIVFAGICISFLCIFCALAVIPAGSENTVNVFDSTIRLRVVANSDSEYDQALKLKVRDGIIVLAEEIFSDCTSADDAVLSANGNMSLIEETARRTLKENGSDMPVTVRLVKERCPVRRYSEFTFPAGEYLTLRIDLGNAEGKNWWCVMYPPLCLGTASGVYADVQTFKAHGFSDRQIEELKNPEKTVKFALYEFCAQIFGGCTAGIFRRRL